MGTRGMKIPSVRLAPLGSKKNSYELLSHRYVPFLRHKTEGSTLRVRVTLGETGYVRCS
jgi:hypothetical protein